MTSFFIIPVMFLQCLAWNAKDNENIAGFKFDQAVTVRATNQSTVWVNNTEFNVAPFCYAIEAYDYSYVAVGDVFFVGSNRPLVVFPANGRTSR